MTATVSTTERPTESVRTLGEAAPVFYRHASPLLLTAAVVGMVTARVVVGGADVRDAAIVVAVVALQPFIEWLIHVTVLHARPVTVAGRTVDLRAARKHRRHHADPRNLRILFIPLDSLVVGAIVVGGLQALLPTWSTRLTLGATAAVLALLYEWTHFLIHTDYKPKTAAYRRLYQGHRLHHFRNENYWFGVTRRFGDTVLRTNPGKDAVPVSPTCRSLLAD